MEQESAEYDTAVGGRRSRSRLHVDLPARLVTTCGTQSVRLLDLSIIGARVRLGDSVFAGKDALLEWAGFEAFGRIVWADRQYCGLRFEGHIPPVWLVATRDLADVDQHSREVQHRRMIARNWVEGGS